ncbi:Diaminopropionate ammonia-lyase [Achromobacter insolitus]|uniref:Diaminopropionate ammonia-lyase n=2 Tax=Achromobacter insolitus TaxID=217204 RepID=A0A6S7F160_9BURK|nr:MULTISPECIES: diaminopropionate ammonia-lyase [Achromobacter]APX74740.1 diaminopropionate ammonia-lyase [Achromobacter insolitus]MEB3097313.1 diaminopropionate ammonia-lyase [Achromobacter sp. D10]OAE51517.1 diaminopropionate ammonia-lyase [Achromobacter insolitus]OCZ54066.1 diaminopropionate ammonia-lyase [Achromobacter insolitus]OWT60625.1 diaminopropionate ammonia-lyase [Achromobacter insolitus]
MNHPIPNVRLQYAPNPAFEPAAPYGKRQLDVLGGQAYALAEAQIRRWPGYQPTPLRDLSGLARAVGVAGIRYKDEGGRFGLGSFKALGGAYAVSRQLLRELAARLGRDDLSVDDLLSGRYRELTQAMTVTCATDGNHGRSVAWGAQRFGCQCVIYIHATVSEGRKRAIEQYGAQVVRTAGNYDDSVRQAAQDAARLGRYVVSDTSYPGYMEVPKDVMQGYAVMADEALRQLREAGDGELPTHVFLQGGVGGLAAAVCAHFWEQLGERRPRFIVVEPDKAACLYESARAGKPVAVHGDLDTVMAGLACGEVSLLAWEVLHPGAQAFLTVDDEAALETVRLLADGKYGDAPIVAGESAVAGLTGCLAALADPALRDALGLDAGSRVLVFGSEGATDPELYQRIVGRSAAEVQAEAVA